ncbi:amino acid adenylation domain-containing protein [Streptomyces sp. NPDC050355]|uniref:amino acid adenylation domain-containing protein n=1 Tax=Streptomyces sp. NPDC050355 TaxID=3365609 RepID=UPI00379603A0
MNWKDGNGDRGLPLTAAQMGVWFAQQLDTENALYRAAEYVDIHGPVDLAVLRAALCRAVADTPALQVRFGTDDEGRVRQVLDRSLDWPLPVVDLRGAADPTSGPSTRPVIEQGVGDPASGPWAKALRWMWTDLRRPADLRHAPLFSFAALLLPDDHCVLYLSIHHIVLDGYGFSLFIQRVAELYTALEAAQECPPSTLGSLDELLADEAAYLASEELTRDREYWAAQLAPHLADAGTGGRGTSVPHGFVRETGYVPAPVAAGLRALARRCRSGLPAVAIAALALYMHRMSGSPDVMLDVTVTGRSGAVARRVPGMLANNLPLHVELGPDTSVYEFVRHTSERARGLLRHQRYPARYLVQELGFVHPGGYAGDWGINIMGYDPQLSFGRHPAMLHNLSNGPVTGLGVNVYERSADGSLRIDFNADPGLYDAQATAAHHRRFLTLLDTLAGIEPGQAVGGINLLSAVEHSQVTTDWNATARAVPTTTLPELIQEQARRIPAATALVCGDTTLSYAELNSRANRLAHALIERGAGPESFVALALPRSAEHIVGLLAVLKTGAASVPLDPDLPTERLRVLLADVRPQCVLTTTATTLRLPVDTVTLPLDDPGLLRTLDRRPDRDPTDDDRLAPLSPGHPVYVSYTSGSTGSPNGVVVEHRQLTNLFFDHQAELIAPAAAEARRRLRAALTATFSFDTAWEGPLFLAAGQELHLIEDTVRLDPTALVDHIAERRIDFLDVTPTYLRQLIAAGLFTGDQHRPKILMVGGEAIDPALWKTLRAQPGTHAYNYYGPTECTVDAVYCRLADQGDTPVIGRPGHNIQAYVLDSELNPMPPGVPGELYLAGSQVARGYLNRPELSAERFVANPFAPVRGDSLGETGVPSTPGPRMYRTGDQARWTAEGTLEYLGRIDGQVKVRGLRIELGEIESVLAQHPDVALAVVTVREDSPGDQRLTAYVVPVADPATHARTRAAPRSVPGPRNADTAPFGPASFASTSPVDTAALRAWAVARLPAYMVPGAFVLLQELPLTTNGKLNRAALPAPETLAVPGGRQPKHPREMVLCALFAEALGRQRVGIDDDFFSLGGHSLMAVKLISRIRAALGTELPIGALFEAPTVAELVRLVEADSQSDGFGVLLPLRAQGTLPPLFCIHPSGGLSWCYAGLLPHLGPDRPVYGLQARGLTLSGNGTLPVTYEEMVADYVEQIQDIQPTGPYSLLGWSSGGAIAHSIAARLQGANERVALLAMLDSHPIDAHETTGSVLDDHDILAVLLEAAGHDPGHADRPMTVSGDAHGSHNDLLASLKEHPALGERQLAAFKEVLVNSLKLAPTFVESVFHGDLLFFNATQGKPAHAPSGEAWRRLVTGRIENRDIACTHNAMTQPAPLAGIGRELAAHLDSALLY